MIKWESATNQQLMTIANSDHDCPTHLLSGVALEMITRRLWDGVIIFSAKKSFKNVNFVLTQRLKIDHAELIHIAHIEIMNRVKGFKPGFRTLKTYIIMCLRSKFSKMIRDVHAEMRYSNIGTVNVDKLPENTANKLFESPINVERHVVNKIMIESGWGALREVEKKAILLDQQGYEQYEIAEMLGYKSKTFGNILLKRAYKKMKVNMGA